MDYSSYQALVVDIGRIDKDAAKYLLGLSEEERGRINHQRDTNLWGVMVWGSTPQGHDYWSKIQGQLEYPND